MSVEEMIEAELMERAEPPEAVYDVREDLMAMQQQIREENQRDRLNQKTYQRESLAAIRSCASTISGMAARESRREREAAEKSIRRRRKAIRLLILVWAAVAGVCIGFIAARADGLASSNVTYFVNATAVSLAMYVSGYLYAWAWK